MKRFLIPDLYEESFLKIDIQSLKALGIRGIIFDLDNTLIKWGNYTLTEDLVQFITSLKDQGFNVSIVSNNSGSKITNLAMELNVPIIQGAKKPSRRSFLKAMKIMGTESSDTAMVGDQIFTDIIGGNRSGLYTVLVNPISNTEFIGTRFVRLFERYLLRYLKRKGYLESTQANKDQHIL